MKSIVKYFIILVIFTHACAGIAAKTDTSAGMRYSIEQSEHFESAFSETAWSRLHYYIYTYLSYPVPQTYNPYLIHSTKTKPFRNFIITREISASEVILHITYTADIKISTPGNEEEQPEEMRAMKYLIEDMAEYLKKGKHLHNLKKTNNEKQSKTTEKQDRQTKEKEEFFFY